MADEQTGEVTAIQAFFRALVSRSEMQGDRSTRWTAEVAELIASWLLDRVEYERAGSTGAERLQLALAASASGPIAPGAGQELHDFLHAYASGAMSDEDFVKRLDRTRPLRSAPDAPAPNRQAPEDTVPTDRAAQILEELLDAHHVERSAADPQRVFSCFCSFLRMPLCVAGPAELDEELVFVEWTPSPSPSSSRSGRSI